ncbi:hypothetical protein OH77DRAFT_1424172 [Trametes cingulata]|nr:hypothetical protein OH77DRAFT_1424172 [Trametes cingulata]
MGVSHCSLLTSVMADGTLSRLRCQRRSPSKDRLGKTHESGAAYLQAPTKVDVFFPDFLAFHSTSQSPASGGGQIP